MRQWLRLVALMAGMQLAMGATIAQEATVATPDPAVAARRDLEQQEQILNDPTLKQETREQAAARLVSRSTKEADQILMRSLRFGRQATQIAVAKALASDPTPEAEFIGPLGDLLGTGQITDAAAQALATFRSDSEARQKLVQFAGNTTNRPDERISAIRAMGKLADKSVAEQLVGLFSDNSVLIRDAATDALIEMTGLTRYGRDVQQWMRWWQDNRNKSPGQWTTDLLTRNVRRTADLENKLLRLRKPAEAFIRELYTDATVPEADRNAKIIKHLQSESEDVRAIAAHIVYERAARSASGKIPDPILEVLRGMIGDSSAEVRVEVALALGTAADTVAVSALLAQLQQEPEPEVRTAIIKAMGPSRDIKTLKPLLDLLKDPSFGVAKAAADALRDLGPDLRKPENAERAEMVAQRLLDRLRGIEGVGSESLRVSVVEAMGGTGHKSAVMLTTYYALLNDQNPLVRIGSLRGLSIIGDPDSASALLRRLDDPDRSVRMEAIKALGQTAGFEHANEIGKHLSEEREPDADVRDRVWEVLAKLCEKGSVTELKRLVAQFTPPNGRTDTAVLRNRRLAIQTIIEAKLVDAGRDEDLAIHRQNLGETLALLEKYDEAAVKFREAADYWLAAKRRPDIVDHLVLQLMETLLRAGKYADAAKFATDALDQNPAYLPNVWRPIQKETERLQKVNNEDGALALIAECKKIPLGNINIQQLTDIENTIKKRRTSGGAVWVRQNASPNDAVCSPLRRA